MPNISDVPIDWANVNWHYVIVLSVIVFFSILLCTLAFRGAVMSALVFAAAFVFYTYYPHGLPLPTSYRPKGSSSRSNRSAAALAVGTVASPDAIKSQRESHKNFARGRFHKPRTFCEDQRSYKNFARL